MKNKTLVVSLVFGILLSTISTLATAAPLKVLSVDDCGKSLMVSAILKGNIHCENSIFINEPNISLNLNGYTLSSTEVNILVLGVTGFSLVGGTIAVARGKYGLQNEEVSTLSVSKVSFVGTEVGGYSNDTGIKVRKLAKVDISNSTFTNLTFGIDSYQSNIFVSNSKFNKNYLGFYSFEDSFDKIQASNFSNNYDGILAVNTGNFTITSTNSDNNQYNGIEMSGVGVVNISSSYARYNAHDGIAIEGDFNISAGVSSSVINTIASDNKYRGIALSYTTNMTVKGNITNNNLNTGLEITGNYGRYTIVSASSNTAIGNSYFGLFAQYAAYGSGNKASLNYLDCQGFVCTKNK